MTDLAENIALKIPPQIKKSMINLVTTVISDVRNEN